MNALWEWLMDFGQKLYMAFIYEDRWKLYVDGLGVTLTITVGAICISTVLGMMLCLMRLSNSRVLSGVSKLYIDVIRGIPAVVQLMFIYFVILSTWTNKTAVGIIAFGLNSAAYTAEIFRSGITAVDPGQMEAGRSLGLTKVQTMWNIIFPQGIKNCLPTYASEFIVLVKETAVVGYIGMVDLTKAGNQVKTLTYDAMAPLLIVALMYLAVTTILSKVFGVMERRLRESDRR